MKVPKKTLVQTQTLVKTIITVVFFINFLKLKWLNILLDPIYFLKRFMESISSAYTHNQLTYLFPNDPPKIQGKKSSPNFIAKST